MGVGDVVMAVFLGCFFGGLAVYGLVGWIAKHAVQYIRRHRRVMQVRLAKKNCPVSGNSTEQTGKNMHPYCISRQGGCQDVFM